MFFSCPVLGRMFFCFYLLKNLKLFTEDDDELMLNVLRCHLTY